MDTDIQYFRTTKSKGGHFKRVIAIFFLTPVLSFIGNSFEKLRKKFALNFVSKPFAQDVAIITYVYFTTRKITTAKKFYMYIAMTTCIAIMIMK